MAEITAKFRERALLVLQYVADEEMKKAWYHEMLRSDIWQFVSRSYCKTLEEMIKRDREREIDLEVETKRNLDEVQVSGGSGKRPKVVDTRGKGHQGRGCYGKCGRSHEGMCKVGGSGCFQCGRTGHIGRNYTATTTITLIFNLICFQYNHRDHKKAHCLSLAAVGPMSASALATLRITDGRLGRVDAPAVKNMDFLLTVEEACNSRC